MLNKMYKHDNKDSMTIFEKVLSWFKKTPAPAPVQAETPVLPLPVYEDAKDRVFVKKPKKYAPVPKITAKTVVKPQQKPARKKKVLDKPA